MVTETITLILYLSGRRGLPSARSLRRSRLGLVVADDVPGHPIGDDGGEVVLAREALRRGPVDLLGSIGVDADAPGAAVHLHDRDRTIGTASICLRQCVPIARNIRMSCRS